MSQASRLASVSEKAHFERATTVRYWPSESRWTDEWRADQPIKTLVRHHQKGPGERSETKAALPVNNPSQLTYINILLPLSRSCSPKSFHLFITKPVQTRLHDLFLSRNS